MTDQPDASALLSLPVDTEEGQDPIFHPSSKLPERSQQHLTSKRYHFRKDSRRAIIVNNLHKETGESDSKLMAKCLEQSEFSVQNHLKQGNFEEYLKKVSEEMTTDTDCFVCAVLARGGIGYVNDYSCNASETKILTIEKLCEPFKGNNCKPLVLKPKIFIIMSWEKEPGSRIVCDGDTKRDVFKVPTESDVLVYVCHMSGGTKKQGYDDDGSWFIKTLSDVMQEEKDRGQSERRDFLRLLTIVNRKMANRCKGCKDPPLKRSDCIPTVTSTLTKQIYF